MRVGFRKYFEKRRTYWLAHIDLGKDYGQSLIMWNNPSFTTGGHLADSDANQTMSALLNAVPMANSHLGFLPRKSCPNETKAGILSRVEA
jgi:hypothetical protein